MSPRYDSTGALLSGGTDRVKACKEVLKPDKISIHQELGRRRMAGEQEDMIADVAMDMRAGRG